MTKTNITGGDVSVLLRWSLMVSPISVAAQSHHQLSSLRLCGFIQKQKHVKFCLAGSLLVGPDVEVKLMVGWVDLVGSLVYTDFMSRLQQQSFYGSVMCSLMGSPCLEGWFGEVACDGWVPRGRVWAMGTPPGTNPSIGPASPPGAIPITPGGNLEKDRK